MVQRLKTTREGWAWVFKILYMVLALPCLLFLALASLLTLSDVLKSGDLYQLFFYGLIWAAILIPVAIFTKQVISKRRILKVITNDVKDPEYFMPEQGYEMYHEGDGKYLGIDIKRGTILYVHRIRKGEVDVVGLDMKDWTNREVEGKMFRLYTKLPELPRIEISTPWAQRWFDTLGSMEFKQYQPAMPFSEYVDIHREQLERENHIAIPRLA
ncbi:MULTISPECIES: plasmid IncI1-type surface exclusion protein ExcA [Serratia]|uniref:Plasmid IncI1-type surface exclusion protein ExcA n=1 Tax=Serratia ureilytica TaxID=300181 RepID=A0ABU0VRZ5_9GAMM|nr:MULTISPECIES: plasmid IncI1-type surface exclusion protein ExcA [Serratia]ASL95927.1 ethanolamine utilization protein EutG [Serratia marcescens]MCU7063501.1 plasmid IncI1-type surface exclusion protein ExcA [Serratia ureilytica]MDQ1811547.1 plasmid IncI1-type surface exclusion protein ExcA [Serratia ureilytica]MDQ1840568.1 plasmid IncI1-type surface exclusion protein ExcA [Serratia ureilytica]MDQ1864212.1 plasmid IncI1-type surface exclusion protein ExcA [Serratia ureilytica]